jgi:hypothetical protein
MEYSSADDYYSAGQVIMCFYRIKMFITMFIKFHHWDPTLRQMNPVYTFIPYFCWFPKWSLPVGFPWKVQMQFFSLSPCMSHAQFIITPLPGSIKVLRNTTDAARLNFRTAVAGHWLLDHMYCADIWRVLKVGDTETRIQEYKRRLLEHLGKLLHQQTD